MHTLSNTCYECLRAHFLSKRSNIDPFYQHVRSKIILHRARNRTQPPSNIPFVPIKPTRSSRSAVTSVHEPPPSSSFTLTHSCSLPDPSPVTSVTFFRHSSSELITGDTNGQVYLICIFSDSLSYDRFSPFHRAPITATAITSRNELLLTSALDKTTVIWDVASRSPIKVVYFQYEPTTNVVLNPVNDNFACLNFSAGITSLNTSTSVLKSVHKGKSTSNVTWTNCGIIFGNGNGDVVFIGFDRKFSNRAHIIPVGSRQAVVKQVGIIESDGKSFLITLTSDSFLKVYRLLLPNFRESFPIFSFKTNFKGFKCCRYQVIFFNSQNIVVKNFVNASFEEEEKIEVKGEIDDVTVSFDSNQMIVTTNKDQFFIFKK
ncbi:hypothetical protein P9112_009116 [Eukaryota sp. TZLM1-RC]